MPHALLPRHILEVTAFWEIAGFGLEGDAAQPPLRNIPYIVTLAGRR